MEETISRYFIILWNCIIFMPGFYKKNVGHGLPDFWTLYQRILEEDLSKILGYIYF